MVGLLFEAEDGIRVVDVTVVRSCFFFFQAEDGIRDVAVTGVQTCALPISTNNAQQYVSSPYYDAGVGDLYTYGSWFDYPGFGYCWRPIGAGFGWSPFTLGQWAFVPGIGWTWVSLEPWGWMPYHFGGWFFSPMYGWVWVPSGIGLGTGRYWRPVTAVWVRSGTTTGLVPVHPLDVKGKTPINLAHGVIRTPGMGGTVGKPTVPPIPGVRKIGRAH